jgi:hypothetical protein
LANILGHYCSVSSGRRSVRLRMASRNQSTRLSPEARMPQAEPLGRLPSGDRWDDADLIALFHGGVLVVKEADIFVIEEDVDEAADIPLFIANTLGEAGI